MYHKNPNINQADLCASFEQTATDMLITNTIKAMEQCKTDTIVLAGGVSANSYIRKRFLELGQKRGVNIYYPELKLCTDNAAMIASAAYYDYLAGKRSDLTLNAIPNLTIE